jgi:protein-disulfide isomerase
MGRLGLALGLVLAAAGVVAGLYAARPVWAAVMPPADYDREQVRAELANIPHIGEPGEWPVVRFYSDFFCQFCRKKEPLAKEMVEKYKDDARFYFLDIPIHGSASELYITMFLASHLAGNDSAKIMAVRDALFHHAENKVLDPTVLVTALRNMGVEMITESEPLEKVYASAIALAHLDGVTSTPTVVVEDRVGRRMIFKGRFERQDLERAIEAAN